MLPKQMRYLHCAMPRIPDRRYRWGGDAIRLATACNQINGMRRNSSDFRGL